MLIATWYKSSWGVPPVEGFVNTVSILQTTQEEALQILKGTWNETISDPTLQESLTLYYSSFSLKCREQLNNSPSVWSNLVQTGINKMAAQDACSITDNKIVFSVNPLLVYSSLMNPSAVYQQGLPMSLNSTAVRGYGPKGMNIGINNFTAVKNQEFTLFMLLKFRDQYDNLDSMTLFESWANTPTNVGIKLQLTNITKDNGAPTFTCVPKLTVVDTVLHQPATPVLIDKYKHYMLTMRYNKKDGAYACAVDLLELEYETQGIKNKLNGSVAYSDVLEFSNKQLQLGDITATNNPVSLLAFGVCNRALSDTNVNTLAQYFITNLQKTSPAALQVYSTFAEMKSCPFTDRRVCDACSVVDWSSPVGIMQAPVECKTAFNAACVESPNIAGCECYLPENRDKLGCVSLRKLLTGSSTCSAAEIEQYTKQIINDPSNKFTMRGIIDYYDNILLEVKAKSTYKAKSFLEWLFGL